MGDLAPEKEMAIRKLSSGFFITFEGTEGAGKSTQITRLAERLEEKGLEVVVLREPGGTVIGERIRSLLKDPVEGKGMTAVSELLLMNAARAQLVEEIIRPALRKGQIVLCDRFYDSTVVYQGHGRGVPLNRVMPVIEMAVGECQPDLTLLLRTSVGTSERRRSVRDTASGAGGRKDRFESEDNGFFQKIEQGFDACAKDNPDRIKVIDAEGSIDEVANRLWLPVLDALGMAR